MFIQNAIKYFIVGLLAFANFTGLFIVSKLHEETKTAKEPPSTTVVRASVKPISQINEEYEQLPEEHDQASRLASYDIQFKHGDISWLPVLAAEAGWPEHTWDKLGQIILRESGGCPNRRGGDMVDKDCNITGVATWTHRSDTGLLQINGVNYNKKRNKWAAVCNQMNICKQAPLLDPLTNLKAGKLLYDISGWEPWNACNWDPKRCPKDKSVSN